MEKDARVWYRWRMTEPNVTELPIISPDLASALQTALLTWYDQHKRDLPWRHTRDPYAIWVSEVMLQQTQVVTMVPYYRRFMERFPDVATLAGAPLQSVLKMWQGLGYYSRARHLHQAARIMCDTFGATVPARWDHLRALPGIGDYIAAAVASIAFDLAHAVVDGNVKRVLARLFMLDAPVNTPAGHRLFQRIATLLLARDRPGDYNQALMELGARICMPRAPRCVQCPLNVNCRALEREAAAYFSKRRPRAALPVQHAATVLLERGRQILMVQRPATGLLGGFWELPGAPVPTGRDAADAVRSHLQVMLGLQLEGFEHVGTVRHAYTHFKLELMVFRGTRFRENIRCNGSQSARWIQKDRLDAFPLHGATLKALTLLKIECASGLRSRGANAA